MPYVLNTFDVVLLLVISLAFIVPFYWRLLGHSRDEYEYFLASRQMSVFFIAASLAGSWVWAPALLVCSQMAYQKGLAGAIWFIVPNVACFFVLIPIARRMKRRYSGYTLAGYFSERVGVSKAVLAVFAMTTLAFLMCALIENSIAINLMLKTVTDLSDPSANAVLFAITAASVILIIIHGFRGSVVTDTVQMVIMVGLCVGMAGVLTFAALPAANPAAGLGGSTGEHLNPFEWGIVLSPGLAFLLGLIGGPMADMMFFQRIMALKDEREITITLSLAGVLFAIVPITLSVPGFIAAANPAPYADANPEAIGLVVTATIASKLAVLVFCFIIVTGLMTTINAAYSAITAVVGSDFVSLLRPWVKAQQVNTVRLSGIIMSVLALIAYGIAVSGVNLLPVFLTDTGVASSMIVPVVYAAFARRVVSTQLVIPLLCSFIFAICFGVAGVIVDSDVVSSVAAPGAFVIGIVALIIVSLLVRPHDATPGEAKATGSEPPQSSSEHA